MAHFLYTIIIYPLYQIIEFIFQLFYELCWWQSGIAIIGVSIGVTLLCLPLYAVAERWQEIERDTEKRLKPGLDRIKKTFSGDERYMMTSVYYGENHYSPIMALRSSFSLLIQIPFFIAAYNFLSHCEKLPGASFLFIKDLGSPDALLRIGGVPLNVLPLAMTAINIIAGIVYTKGFPLKEKLQLFGMALIFLIILYSSPSGLVFYWTMNNVFSLIKNIFYKLKNPVRKFYIGVCIAVLIIDAYFLKIKFKYFSAILTVSLFILALPLISSTVKYFFKRFMKELVDNDKLRLTLFLVSAVGLAVLTGAVIPTLLMTSSTPEYCYVDGYTSPFFFLYNTLLQTTGCFIFWPLCIYVLYNKKVKAVISFAFCAFLFIALADCFLFPGNYGVIQADLTFTEHRSFKPSLAEFACNMLVIAVIVVLAILFCAKQKTKILYIASSITCITLFAFSLVNVYTIRNTFKTVEPPQLQMAQTEPILHLSKDGKNVILFMLDRAMGFFTPEIFKELPELYDQYTGFTFYPNTVSFGRWTIQGAPPLYGGYEYTPWAMNHKPDLTMVEKHNQSESMLALIFEQAGYTCDIVDPPYPNYDSPPVYKAFEGHEDIHAIRATGKYSNIWYAEHNYTQIPIKSRLIKRNMLWFSIFRIVPNIMRSAIHYEDWWLPGSRAESNADFIDRYAVLDYLPELTDTDSSKQGFILIDNESTHDTAFCQAPEYVPQEHITNFGTSIYKDKVAYSAMAASLKRIGEWLDFLKAKGVYDNTRIILVADHGSAERSSLFDDAVSMPHNLEWFNPLLMVKDFGATGPLETDMSFMTHADSPAIALDGLVDHPVNPYTGKEIRLLDKEEKEDECIISFSQANAVRKTVNNGFKIKDSEWYTVHDSIFKRENWAPLDPKDKQNQ